MTENPGSWNLNRYRWILGSIIIVYLLLAVGGVPPASGHAAQLAIDALRSLLLRLQAR